MTMMNGLMSLLSMTNGGIIFCGTMLKLLDVQNVEDAFTKFQVASLDVRIATSRLKLKYYIYLLIILIRRNLMNTYI